MSKKSEKLQGVLAPSGWNDVGIDQAQMDVVVGASMRWYIMAVLASPLVLAPAMLYAFWTAPSDLHAVLSVFIGYTALTVIACFTAAATVAVAAFMLLRAMKIIRFRLDFSGAFKTLAAAVGYGTAIGALTAAIMPVAAMLFSSIFVRGEEPNHPGGFLTPGILFELPACGAIAGYLIGLVVMIVNMGKGSQNILYRRGLIPALFAASILALTKIGLTPTTIFEELIRGAGTSEKMAGITCATEASKDLIDSIINQPPFLASLVADCYGAAVPNDQIFTLATVSIVVIASAVAFFSDVRSRVAQRAE